MSGWHFSVGLIGLLGGLLFSSTALLPMPMDEKQTSSFVQTETLLANLPDGAYQLCTDPDPQDWRDGAGICLNMVKQGTSIEGYYGYPHSSDFVCLRGQVFENLISGEGLVISWTGHTWSDIPQDEFVWDEEGRLSLGQGSIARRENEVSWIVFRRMSLDTQGLYRYPEPRMTPPTQLCDWSTI
ncbi:MAG: hypothetical protein WBA10_13245 [Elainellaceae cyanobacterium]